MVRLGVWNEISSRFARLADFVVVYTQEVHAADEWSLGKKNYQIDQHLCMEDRLKAAEILAEKVTCPVVVDSMANKACSQYSGRPERLYIIQRGIIQYISDIFPKKCRIEDVEEWLERSAKTIRNETILLSKMD